MVNFIQRNNLEQTDVISLFKLNIIPKSNSPYNRLDFIPPSSLSATVLYGVIVVCIHYFEWLHSVCEWAKRSKDIFSQLRPRHIYTLVKGKWGDKRFSLPSSITVPVYRFLYLSTIDLPSRVFFSLSVIKVSTLTPQWLLGNWIWLQSALLYDMLLFRW